MHWTKFLPEAGGLVTRKGDSQERLAREILEAQRELNALKLEYRENEVQIDRYISLDWTQEEIQEAKELEATERRATRIARGNQTKKQKQTAQ